MNVIRKLFEEDIEMQDAVEDIDDLVDDTDDAIIEVIENAYADHGLNLFTEKKENEDLEADLAIISLSDDELEAIEKEELLDDEIDSAIGDIDE